MLIRRKTEEHEIELTTGEIIPVTVRELTMKELDDFFEIEKKIHEEILNNNQKKNIFSKNTTNTYDLIKKITIDSFVEALRHSEPRWKIITGMEDVSFINTAFPSSLECLDNLFVELNPLLKELKKNLQQSANLIQILEDYRKEIQKETQTENYQEFKNEVLSVQE